MKKTILVFSIFLLGIEAYAQEKGFGKKLFERLNVEMKTQAGVKQHDITPLVFNGQLSYNVTDKFALMMGCEYNLALIKTGNAKSYMDGGSIGGGIGYNWFSGKKDVCDLRLQVLTTLGHPDWKFTTYDIGTTWHPKHSRKEIMPILGFGFRFQRSHTDGIRNWGGLYATFGFRL